MLSALVLITVICNMMATSSRFTMIQDFESGSVNLTSWADQDIAPYSWNLDTTYTYNSSNYALKLYGNTWKQLSILPLSISQNDVLQVAIRHSSGSAGLQGIGFSDGTHTLFYSVEGTQEANIEEWVTVYQGAFNSLAWNLYGLPVADDWYAYFDELPTLTSVVFINDLDSGNGSIWFDNLCNISDDLPAPPTVTTSYNLGRQNTAKDGTRNVTASFFSTVSDEDSSVFTYLWDFGDSTSSTLANPVHTYTISDDHPYSVTLKVTDNTECYGYARCQVNVDQGTSSLPVKLNFVGDVMLARNYEAFDGIIPTLGVNAIFQPTKYLLGDAADITSANLEVVLTNQGTAHPTKSVVYRGNPANVTGLVYAGIDIVSVANNHILDYGIQGLQQMLSNLDANHILYNGSGANSYEAYTPAFVNRNGLNLAFLRSCDRTGQYNNAQPFLHAGFNKPGFALFTPYYLTEQLDAVEDVADLRIVEMHGGSEYSLVPGGGYDKNSPFADEMEDDEYAYYSDVPHQWDIDIRHTAIDEGADLVIVHHPHILHGFEVYNGKLIAHSLGNFVFDLSYPETLPTIILNAEADFDGFSNFQIVPCFIDDYIPRRANGKLGTHILDYLAKRSRDLHTYMLIDYDNVTATIVMDSTALTSYPIENNVQLPLTQVATGTYMSEPFLMSRFGSVSSIDLVSPGNGQARVGQECVWMQNMENEGSTFWDVNGTNEVYDTNIFHEGTRSIRITSTTSTSTVPIQSKMKWYDNTRKFTLHAWLRTQNATNVNVKIQYYDSRTSNSAVSTENLLNTALSGNNPWTFFQKEITIPTSCSYYIIVCSVGGGAGWFDEVGLIEWTEWQSISQWQSIPAPNDYYWMQVKSDTNPKRIRVRYTETSFELNNLAVTGPVQTQVFCQLTNYPNPFNPETTISFNLKEDADVTLNIYNIKGQRVRQIHNGHLLKGRQSFIWDGRDSNHISVGSGVYFYKVNSGKQSVTRKVILIK